MFLPRNFYRPKRLIASVAAAPRRRPPTATAAFLRLHKLSFAWESAQRRAQGLERNLRKGQRQKAAVSIKTGASRRPKDESSAIP
ncbi:hypothetical protein PsYK624_051440 [Phanerochaete sordida]|uniref:Uncharacterized protein n=1 Tax=Phanerochaete sordida TaxID=48140 RepID=A0A9P3G743_9APHY|nr:hypothetical protein PsYK624_051440 [Phanerochaete sordida]